MKYIERVGVGEALLQDKSARGGIEAARAFGLAGGGGGRPAPRLLGLSVGHDRGFVSPSDEAGRETAGRAGVWMTEMVEWCIKRGRARCVVFKRILSLENKQKEIGKTRNRGGERRQAVVVV